MHDGQDYIVLYNNGVSVPDEGYSSNVPDEGYSRNALCALNLIPTFY
jgi:hypothetical protein